MKRAFTTQDAGKRFRYIAGHLGDEFHYRWGQLEFPLIDPGSAEPHEGVLWFGPQDDRDGWVYVSPSDVSTK